METRCRLMAGGGDPRESATESKPPRFTVARVKGWGKSPPRAWQQERHGKPHREQDRIGAVRGETLEGCFRLTVRVGCVRRMATCAQDEWPPRPRPQGRGPYRTRLTGQLAVFSHDIERKPFEISRLRPRARLLIQLVRSPCRPKAPQPFRIRSAADFIQRRLDRLPEFFHGFAADRQANETGGYRITSF